MKTMLTAMIAPLALVAMPAMADHHAALHPMASDPAMDNAAPQSAVQDAGRTADAVRDIWRHPAETLAFFQVKPGMTVIDYMPAGGWYTRVLVPYLGAQGRYIGLTPDAARSDDARSAQYFAGLPGKFAQELPKWNLAGAPVMTVASDAPDLAAYEGRVDRALIFREMHNLFRSGLINNELTRIRALLTDEGMLGIVQHRAGPSAPASYTEGSKGYLRQKDVVALVEAHGFDLVDSSEINANPRDTANHPAGVWELSPNFSTKRNAELEPIGESDRMTLLFRKRS
ncbi:hypothetical protein RM533_09935 [Croceicoccus sp. F390]|uniref:Methyltransferase n=1 Tax=Croceicoccus esteveae TaxID=3075597 RepID=A0ABU2ZIR7_9SPHN|nr:hypothetical protein [Croceicoccus sp. F390]MDT0576506.1 hypothetical protein [Croceicoccus sp. F390]